MKKMSPTQNLIMIIEERLEVGGVGDEDGEGRKGAEQHGTGTESKH